MNFLAGKQLVVNKTYIRDNCDKCQKRTRLIVIAKMKDEGKDAYSVECETCKTQFIVDRTVT